VLLQIESQRKGFLMLHFSSKKTAFTLIELLVVVAIIAMLTAILFPVFARVRENARKTSCISNLKQIGLGIDQYGQDYDQRIMTVSMGGGTGKTRYWWALVNNAASTIADENDGLLFPYMKNTQVQACPSFDNKLRAALKLTGYGYNYAYITNSTTTMTTYANLVDPVRTVVMADSAQINFMDRKSLQGNTFMEPPNPKSGGPYPTFHGRHNGMGNVLWADGHVKAYKPLLRRDTIYNFEAMQAGNLGELDEDGDLKTNELFILDKTKTK
jgi:prepilin-type processing-associated H-X9-DG protein/prepilin-type N-terminal cleavage/methylation domain-containing protein